MFLKTVVILTVSLIMSGCVSGRASQIAGKKGSFSASNVSSSESMSAIKDFVGGGKYRNYEPELTPIKSKLLVKSPTYAQKYQKQALEKNMYIQGNMPLFSKPLFAQTITFPYVAKSGAYHGYQEGYIKIKDGQFALAPIPYDETQGRSFGINRLNEDVSYDGR